MPEAVFHPDGERFVPTELARGPWDPGAQHGGAPAALLARALERHEPVNGMIVARLSVEFLRPVPLAPLEIAVRETRPGKRVQLLEASLLAEGTEVCRATALRIRRAAATTPESGGGALPAGPEGGTQVSFPLPVDHTVFANAFEILFVEGGFGQGRATAWFRLLSPIVAGERPSPLMRAAAAADFGNGVSSVLPWDEFLFINPDLVVHLDRMPEGEWVCLDAATIVGPDGIGLSESALHDQRGRIGRASQALFIQPR